MARSISFIIEGDVNTRVTVTELDDGTLRFDLQVLGSGLIGDLRALFFDLTDVDVSGLSVAGADITESAFEEGSVDTLGKDANIKGSVSNELGDFDVGIEFGTSGMSGDDIQSTSFILDHDSVDLTLDMLDLQDFGIRFTSVGEEGGDRTGSSKIGDSSNGVADNDVLNVLENETESVDVLANDTNGATNVVTSVVDDGLNLFTDTGSGFERVIVVNGLELGTMLVTADGTASFDANGADVDSLAEGEEVTFTVSYTTTALDGSLATAEVLVTVTGTSDAVALTSPVRIKGIDALDGSGRSVSSAGDVDGDGLDDIVIGAGFADPDGVNNAGESYVIFGAALAAEATGDGEIDLATLTASDGVLIKGIDVSDFSGLSVSSAGDVDGDGLDDIVIGAAGADPDGVISAGENYVIFGAALAAEATGDGEIDLATLTSSEGVLIKGIDEFTTIGGAFSSAGDVDGDGLDDIVIGANGADPDGTPNAGETYVVFGAALQAEQAGDGEIDLATLTSSEGVLIKGIDAFDNSGVSVSSAGDVDGDGLDDIVIGALNADPDGATNAGESYVVFGAALAAEATGDGEIDLATLTSSEGVLIKGIDAFDSSGRSVSYAGDVDGDGLDDIVIGALNADPDGAGGAGESYVVLGSALAAEATGDGEIDLATLTASEGVLIKGIDIGDQSGASVSYAGDVDGDGLDDIVIGAFGADLGGTNVGVTYVVFGAALQAEKTGDGEIDLATLASSEGVLIAGIDAFDQSGASVSSAGDVDGDGLDDIVIGAAEADPDGASRAGESYVVSGAMLTAEQTDDGIIDLGDFFAF